MFYDATQRQTGKRGFILSRYGGWGSERYPGFFTGDAYSEWRVLAYEVAFTARGGNVLVPYISNDIGGFHGAKIPFGLYARWIEFGTFSPILRMHSAHENPLEGNTRMPWVYGPKGVALMRKYFTLRMRLMPYLYTYTWQAHRRSLPLLRPLYLEWPDLDQAYQHFHEYLFGGQMLVAPVLEADGKRSVYLPPGKLDGFLLRPALSGRQHLHRSLPGGCNTGLRARGRDHSGAGGAPRDVLTVNVYGDGNGRFDLYEDDGVSLDYEHGSYALTPMTYHTSGASHQLVIGPTTGSFAGQRQARAIWGAHSRGARSLRQSRWMANARLIGTGTRTTRPRIWCYRPRASGSRSPSPGRRSGAPLACGSPPGHVRREVPWLVVFCSAPRLPAPFRCTFSIPPKVAAAAL